MAFHYDIVFKSRGLPDNLPQWKKVVAALYNRLKEIETDGGIKYHFQIDELNATFQAFPDDAPLEQYAEAALELVEIMEDYLGDDNPDQAQARDVYKMLENTLKAVVGEYKFSADAPIFNAVREAEDALSDLDSTVSDLRSMICDVGDAIDEIKNELKNRRKTHESKYFDANRRGVRFGAHVEFAGVRAVLHNRRKLPRRRLPFRKSADGGDGRRVAVRAVRFGVPVQLPADDDVRPVRRFLSKSIWRLRRLLRSRQTLRAFRRAWRAGFRMQRRDVFRGPREP